MLTFVPTLFQPLHQNMKVCILNLKIIIIITCKKNKYFCELYIHVLPNLLLFLCSKFLSAMNTVLDSVKLEQSRTSINDLCQLDGDEWIFPIFGDNAPPTDMVVQYAVMKSSAHSNDLFHKEWQASRDLDATTDVYYDIWMPLFTFYENLVHKLRNKTITLNEMGSLFGGSEWSENKSNIEKLVAAVSKCTSKQASNIEWLASKISWSSEISIADRIANILPSQPDDARWISQLADEIRQWSTFQQLSPIADVLLDTLQNLNVEKSMYEDFELFSTEVRIQVHVL